MFCRKCGAELPDSARFCNECGTSVKSAADQSNAGQEEMTLFSQKERVVTCWKCGTELPYNARFCKECGASINGVADQGYLQQVKNKMISLKDQGLQWLQQQNQNTVILASVAVAVFLVLIIGISVGSKSTKSNETPVYKAEEPSRSATAVDDRGKGKEPSQPVTVADNRDKAKESSQTATTPSQASTTTTTSKSSSFSITNSQGDRLEVEPGYTYVSSVKAMVNASGRTASILIPPIFDYAGVTYSMGEEKKDGGAYKLTFTAESSSYDFITSYIDALSAYGFTLERTWVIGEGITSSQKEYFLNCSGNVTHGLATFTLGSYDMSIMAYKTFSSTDITFTYPPEVGFDLGGSDEEYKINKVASSYSIYQGKERFDIKGWGVSDSDNIMLLLQPDTYQAGDVIHKSDFKAQSAAGDSALYKLTIFGNTAANSMAQIDTIDEAEVKILEKSDSCIAFSYYIEVTKGSEQYTLEGVSAVKLEGGGDIGSYGGGNVETVGGSSGSGGSGGLTCATCGGGGKITCNYCHGSRYTQCTRCSGKGKVLCSTCNGAGGYWSNGTYRSCTACTGGYKTCTAYGCNGGRVNCTHCHGNGVITCTTCNGRGKY
ncbi:MAG: zinc ribbon domain-containing protein [Acetatifactor sp.]|nr:zinc ribbon domain-containing protein [Acetatifactor sp.]